MTVPKSSAGIDGQPAPGRCGSRRLGVAIRWIEHVLAAATAVLILFVVSPLPGWIYDRLDRQDPLCRADYIVCLGGDPSRIIEAARLMNEGLADKLVVSDNGPAALIMRDLAVEWGAPSDCILLDTGSRVTGDHPRSVQAQCGVDPAKDTIIIVTSYAHLARAKACFVKAGYRHIVMREPRWERQFRHGEGIKRNFWIMPELLYEGAAFVEYKLAGRI